MRVMMVILCIGVALAIPVHPVQRLKELTTKSNVGTCPDGLSGGPCPCPPCTPGSCGCYNGECCKMYQCPDGSTTHNACVNNPCPAGETCMPNGACCPASSVCPPPLVPNGGCTASGICISGQGSCVYGNICCSCPSCCPAGETYRGPCVGGKCADGSVCTGDHCCKKDCQCPFGGLPIAFCDASTMPCPEGYLCTENNWCCPAQPPSCPRGDPPGGACVMGQCPAGSLYVCINNVCCPGHCPGGAQPGGQCVGTPPTCLLSGYTCVNNTCCPPTCPAPSVQVATCPFGVCPTTTAPNAVCINGLCCDGVTCPNGGPLGPLCTAVPCPPPTVCTVIGTQSYCC